MPKNGQNNDIIDKAIVEMKSKNPTMPLNQIAVKLKDAGIFKSRDSVYKRYRRSDYLQRQFAEIEKHADEHLIRILEPAADRVIDSTITKGYVSKKIVNEDGKLVTIKAPVKASKMVDTAMAVKKLARGEKVRSAPSQGINIGAIKNAQFIISDNLGTDDTSNTDS